MLKLLIHSSTNTMKDGSQNPKIYPYFNELILKLKKEIANIKINQLGINKDKKLNNIDNYFFDLKLIEIKDIVNGHDLWISIDSFLPHYCNFYKLRPGIVIFNISDPDIFGYKHNVNLIKDRKYIRQHKFLYYKESDYNNESFVDYDIVFEKIKELLKK